MISQCPRVRQRYFCNECNYPMSEALNIDDNGPEHQDDPQRVAVYGTLRRDLGRGWGMIDGTPIGLGTIEGRMYAHAAYPAVVPEEEGEVVVQVIDYNDLDDPTVWEEAIATMDRIEGVPRLYKRHLVDVTMDDGTVLDAWIYFFSRHPTAAGMDHVPSGDWSRRGKNDG